MVSFLFRDAQHKSTIYMSMMGVTVWDGWFPKAKFHMTQLMSSPYLKVRFHNLRSSGFVTVLGYNISERQ